MRVDRDQIAEGIQHSRTDRRAVLRFLSPSRTCNTCYNHIGTKWRAKTKTSCCPDLDPGGCHQSFCETIPGTSSCSTTVGSYMGGYNCVPFGGRQSASNTASNANPGPKTWNGWEHTIDQNIRPARWVWIDAFAQVAEQAISTTPRAGSPVQENRHPLRSKRCLSIQAVETQSTSISAILLHMLLIYTTMSVCRGFGAEIGGNHYLGSHLLVLERRVHAR